MRKDFKHWTPLKQELHNAEDPRLFFHEREIWIRHVGENVGFEQDGQGELFLRPVVIIRKFNNEIFWGVPLTRSQKDLPFYFTFNIHVEDKENNQSVEQDTPSTAILSQIRLIDGKRLRRLVGYISENDFKILKEKLKMLLP